MAGFNLMQRWQRINNGNPPPTSADVADILDNVTPGQAITGPVLSGTVTGTYTLGGTVTLASQTGAAYLQDATNVGGGKKIAYGSATLVSGVVTVATGLATVISFSTILAATGFATGVTEVTSLVINAATGAFATGDVAVAGYRLFTTTISASGTGKFDWIAIGT